MSVEACHLAMNARHRSYVLAPTASDITFLAGTIPSNVKDTTIGTVGYRDAASGATLSLMVGTSPPWWGAYHFLQGCESVVGTVVGAPQGRSVCLEDPKLGVLKITIIDTVYEQDGVFYWTHIDDRRTPSPTIWAQDRTWALGLVDSYQ